MAIRANASNPEIKPYPGAKHLCGKQAIGVSRNGKPGPHLTWRAYYSKAKVDKVVDFYKKQLGIEKYSLEQDSHKWFFSDSDTHSIKHSLDLKIQKSDTEGPWTSCEFTIPSHGTIIMISSMVGPES